MSAITDSQDGLNEPIQVLITLHPSFDLLDFAGPLEVLTGAQHDPKDSGNHFHSSVCPIFVSTKHVNMITSATKAFEITIAAAAQYTTAKQGCTVRADIDYEEAHDRLSEFDVLVVPGGSTEPVLKSNSEPIALIKAFGEQQTKDPSRERTLLSICTGALFLAQAGALQGMAATTHPDYYTKLEIACGDAARKDSGVRTDVMEERYVVNNARFELGENLDENPFVLSKRPDGRRKSIARKGSNAWKESNRRQSMSNARRASMRLGGLRVITSGGVTAGLDASLYLVAALVSHESAEEVARIAQYTWNKGVVVEGIDV